MKFPTKIRHTIGGHPALDLTVTDVQPNVAVDIPIPGPVLQTPAPYARVASQMVADGVWYVTLQALVERLHLNAAADLAPNVIQLRNK